MSGIVEYITRRTDVFYNEKNQIKEGKTAEDILKDITDTETLQKISDAILIDKNFLPLEEYNELARKDSKKIQQLYRLGHLSKAKSLHTECDIDDLSKAMEAFNLGKKRISGGNSSDEEPEPEEEPEEKPESQPEPEPEEKPESQPEEKPEAVTSDDVEKTFQEIGSKSVEITKLLSSDTKVKNLNNVLSTNMKGLKELTDNIKGKSMECLQTLAMSLFGYELDKVASATAKMILGAGIVSIPSYPNEVGDIILTVFKYSTLSVKYFIKLYITYIIGALAKSGFDKETEKFKSFMNNAKHKLLQIATAASVDITEVQNILEEYIPTVIINEIKKQNMTDFMEAVQTGLQESKEERNRKISNVNFQTQKSFKEIPDNEQEKMITDTPKIGELSEGRLVEMIETEGLDINIQEGLKKKLEKMTGKQYEQITGKRKREDESDDDDDDEYKKQKLGGKKQRTRKQKKQSKKQKKNSKNKSKKQKKNRTKKTRGKKH